MTTLENLGAHTDAILIAQSQAQKEVTSNALDNLLSNATQRRLTIVVQDTGSPANADKTLTTDEFFGGFLLHLTGSPTVAFELLVPGGGHHVFAVRNDTGQAATIRTVGVGDSVVLAATQRQILHADGPDVIALAPVTT